MIQQSRFLSCEIVFLILSYLSFFTVPFIVCLFI